MEKFRNLDGTESVFLTKQLEHVKARTYDKKFPRLKAANGEIFTIDRSAGPAAETTKYYSYESIGVAKIISDYSSGLPRANVVGKEVIVPIRSLGISYGYSLQEVRRANLTRQNLPTRLAESARRGIEQRIEEIAWLGDDEYGLVGLLNNPNITAATVPVGATTGNSTWDGGSPKNADEILEDLNSIVRGVSVLTNQVEEVDTILLPVAQEALIRTTRLGDNADKTIKMFFMENNPEVRRIVAINQLKDVAPLPSGGGGPADCMVALSTSPDVMVLEVPQPFEQLEVQPEGLQFEVPCHARTGGLNIYYPLAVSVYEGI